MSVRLDNDVITVSSPAGVVTPSAEEIFATVFEGKGFRGINLQRDEFLSLGFDFSDSPASPAILFSAKRLLTGEPVIECRLGGKVGETVAAATIDYVIIKNTWYPLPAGAAEEFASLLSNCEIENPSSLKLGDYLQVKNRANDFAIEDHAAEHLEATALSRQLPSPIPKGLDARFYPYQQIGFNWLSFMARQSVGSILADEMGLGKTLQIIATLLEETNRRCVPNLVVCPATLLENWRRELHRFAPGLRVLVHAGAQRAGSMAPLRDANVTVSSYDTVGSDISLFRRIDWNLIALDEAQNIKNPATRRAKLAKELSKRVGIAVTGTPVENRLKDLWSICDFVIPGYLGTEQEFERRFADTIDGAKELEPVVSAIMLRRRVLEVATDLPERIDIPVAITMDDESATAYEELRNEAIKNTPQAPDLAALIYLRMFCAHPWIVNRRKDASAISSSPKLTRCFEILEEVFSANSKALIFTSFNEMADILNQEVLRAFQVPVWKINGDVPVPERQEIVDQFSNVEGGAVLVLNPRAAGVGLNITAANHVIHYNLEWNPAIEDQASARAYRRGQTRPVTVHRLFYAGTVEEAIDDRMTRKRKLAEHAVIGSCGEETDAADILKALKQTPSISR